MGRMPLPVLAERCAQGKNLSGRPSRQPRPAAPQHSTRTAPSAWRAGQGAPPPFAPPFPALSWGELISVTLRVQEWPEALGSSAGMGRRRMSRRPVSWW